MRWFILLAIGCGGTAAPASPQRAGAGEMTLAEASCVRTKNGPASKVCRAEARLREARKRGNERLVACYDEQVAQMHVSMRRLSDTTDVRANAASARIDEIWEALQTGWCERL